VLRDGKPYADPGIDYERIAIGYKASRWLQKLEQYGYVTVQAREEQTHMPTRTARDPASPSTALGPSRGRFRGARIIADSE